MKFEAPECCDDFMELKAVVKLLYNVESRLYFQCNHCGRGEVVDA